MKYQAIITMPEIEVEIDDVVVSIAKGSGREIFYVHSSGSDAEQWKYQLETVGGYAIDLPNHGKSDKAEINSVDDYAYYVSEAIKQICGKAVIAGHSLGGAVAQKVYLNYPETCMGLVLVGTGARLRVLPEILENLKTKPEKAVELILDMAFYRKENEYRKIREKYLRNSDVLYLDLSVCDKFDLLNEYRESRIKIDVPVLLVFGREDRLTPLKYGEFFRNHIPSSHLVVIDEASHMVMLEKPEEFNSALDSFLGKILSD